MVLGVVPGKEDVAVGAGILDRAEARRECRPVLQRLEGPTLSLSLLMLTRKKRSGCKSSVQENDVN